MTAVLLAVELAACGPEAGAESPARWGGYAAVRPGVPFATGVESAS